MKSFNCFLLAMALMFNIVTAQKKPAKTINKSINSKSYNSSDRLKTQQPITSKFHRDNIGEIVFSNDIISKSKPQENLKTVFNITDRIYGRVFLELSPQNTPLFFEDGRPTDCGICTIKYKVFVNGIEQKEVLENKALLGNDENTWTTRQVWLNPKPEDDPADPGWVAIVNRLHEGTHTIKLEYYVTGGTNVTAKEASASGTFKLVKRKGETLSVGKSWSSLKRGINDSELEQALIRLANSNYELTKEDSKYLKVKIYGSAWNIVRNRLTGVPEYRWIEVYFLEKKNNGTCYAQTFPVTQQYDGNDYGNTNIQLGSVFSLRANYNGFIDCE